MSEAFTFQFYETWHTDFPSAADDAVFPSGRENSKWLRQYLQKRIYGQIQKPLPFLSTKIKSVTNYNFSWLNKNLILSNHYLFLCIKFTASRMF